MSTKMFADIKPKTTTNPQTQTQPQQNAQNTRQQAPQKKTFSMFSGFFLSVSINYRNFTAKCATRSRKSYYLVPGGGA